MLKKEELEKLLSFALDSQADFAEIFEEDSESETIRINNETIEEVLHSQSGGIGIRLFKGVQSVYAYSDILEWDNLLSMVNDLKAAIGLNSGESKKVEVSLQEEIVENIHPVFKDPLKASLKEKRDLILKGTQAGLACSDEIFKMIGGLSATRQKVAIANSDGRYVKDTRIRTRLMYQAFARRGDNQQAGFEAPGAMAGLEIFDEIDPVEVAKEAAREALVLLDAKPAPSGVMPVIIENGFGGVIFHEACGHALEATAIAKNQSVFTGKKGEKIANEKVTAIDDGTIVNAWGSENIDDEGNPQQKRVLIENGILKEYMVDSLNGRRMKEESSGSARRQSYKFEPTSRMSNTYIAPGNDTFEEMLEGIDYGLYAKKMGGGTVNPVTGEFNFAVTEGYLIEEGKITEPVIGAMLIGTGQEILQKIDMVGNNLKRAQGVCGSISGNIPTEVGQPTLRVSSLTVGGTSNE